MAEAEKKFTLRLPIDMHTSLNAMAEEELRSLHSMVIVILREAISQWEQQRSGDKAGTPTPTNPA
jgi:hypothetical protein